MKPTKKELKEISASLYESNGLLTAEQEANLVRQIREGNMDALSELLEGNIRFVISVAKNYRDNGVKIPELVAAGTKGLVYAAKTFDESKGVRFLSYAIWWIRESIISALNVK